MLLADAPSVRPPARRNADPARRARQRAHAPRHDARHARVDRDRDLLPGRLRARLRVDRAGAGHAALCDLERHVRAFAPSSLPPPASLIRARRRADAPPAHSRTPISSTRTTRRASRGRRSQCTARTLRSSLRTASTAASRSPLVDTPRARAPCSVPCTSSASVRPRTAVHRAEPPRAWGAGLYPPSARASSARAVRKYIRSTTDRPTRDAPAHARGTHTRFDPFAPLLLASARARAAISHRVMTARASRSPSVCPSLFVFLFFWVYHISCLPRFDRGGIYWRAHVSSFSFLTVYTLSLRLCPYLEV